jgi:chaperonin GroES
MARSKKENIISTPKTIGVRPLMGYLLVEPSEAESRTASGIFLPEGAQEKPAQGKVISVGDDFLLPNGQILRAPVKVGDIVVYKKWGGDELKVHGKEYKIVKFEDLMAIIEE